MDIIHTYVPDLDQYDDSKIVIEDNKLIKYDESICGPNSEFLTHVAFIYGESKAC